MYFSLKIRHLVSTILMIFLRVLPKILCGPTTRGPQELGGPGSLNRLNPRFLRHCSSVIVLLLCGTNAADLNVLKCF